MTEFLQQGHDHALTFLRDKKERKRIRSLYVAEKKKEKQNAHSCFLFIYRLI